MIDYIRVKSKEKLPEALSALATRLGSFWNFDQNELMVSYEAYKAPRTRSQNNLFYLWCGEMANYYSTRQSPFDKDDMHDLMVYKFLGTKDREIGNTKIQAQLRKTSDLKKHEMSEFMHKVEQWNTSNGLYLTIPAENEYMKYREARQ